MAAERLGNSVAEPDPLEAAEQRVSYGLRHDRAGTHVRHVAIDVFENEPPVTEDVCAGQRRCGPPIEKLAFLRSILAAGRLLEAPIGSLELAESARIDTSLGLTALKSRGVRIDQESAACQAGGMPDVRRVARKPVQRRERGGVR